MNVLPVRRVLNTNLRHDPSLHPSRYLAEMREVDKDLRRSWKEVLKKNAFPQDALAGLTVAAVSLPLNIALAISCGLPASVGLIAGAIGGLTAAFLGGSTLSVTGPSTALNVLIMAVATPFGAKGVAAAAVFVGFLQILFFLTLKGNIVRFVPDSLLAGFTTGVGIKLLDAQIPELLGFEYRFVEMLRLIAKPTWLHEVSWFSAVSGLMVAFIMVTAKPLKKFPAALIGIGFVTYLSYHLNWDLKRVGVIEAVIPTPHFVDIDQQHWSALLLLSVPLAFLASAESLLSARALDKFAPSGKPHNSNLELLGQALANSMSGIFGGMPVSAVVIRSSLNLQSGAKTRMSAIMQALFILFAMAYLSDALATVPLAALAGLLCVVGMRLVDWRAVACYWNKGSKLDLVTFLLAMSAVLMGHLIWGLVITGVVFTLTNRFANRKKNAAAATRQQRDAGIRAIIGQDATESRRPVAYEPHSKERNNWLHHVTAKAHVSHSAFVHEDSSVIGRVILGENVHIAADTSVRADEGTPFYIGANTNIQDGVVMHALKNKFVTVDGDDWAIYLGSNVSLAHQALVHGPCFIGDNTFVGFKAVVHDSVVGSRCFIGIGAVVVGVEVPDGKYVPHGSLIDTPEKVTNLPEVSQAQLGFNEDVVEVNKGLVEAYKKSSLGGYAAHNLTKAFLPPRPATSNRF